jgi:hypothetical protein
MNFDTTIAAQYAGQKIDSLLDRAVRDSEAAIASKQISDVVIHFAALRQTYKDLTAKMAKIQAHLDSLSQESIPTMFLNQRVKNQTVDGVGRVAISHRWTASMIEREEGLRWLRANGQGGLIQETVNVQTLGAFAKDQAEAKNPLPTEVFRINTTPFVSITKV